MLPRMGFSCLNSLSQVIESIQEYNGWTWSVDVLVILSLTITVLNTQQVYVWYWLESDITKTNPSLNTSPFYNWEFMNGRTEIQTKIVHTRLSHMQLRCVRSSVQMCSNLAILTLNNIFWSCADKLHSDLPGVVSPVISWFFPGPSQTVAARHYPSKLKNSNIANNFRWSRRSYRNVYIYTRT